MKMNYTLSYSLDMSVKESIINVTMIAEHDTGFETSINGDITLEQFYKFTLEQIIDTILMQGVKKSEY